MEKTQCLRDVCYKKRIKNMIVFKLKDNKTTPYFTYKCVISHENEVGIGSEIDIVFDYGKWVTLIGLNWVKPTPFEMFYIRKELNI